MPPFRPKTTSSSKAATLIRNVNQNPARPVPARRVILLDVPFMYRAVASDVGAIWNPQVSSWCWNKGDSLPALLEPFRSKDYSYERYREDDLNGCRPEPSKPTKDITLRPHQKEADKIIADAKRRGRVGFLLADEVGLGKTLSAWSPILSMRDVKTVLIVAPLAVLEHWRQTVSWLGDGGKRILVVNYDRIGKLLDVGDDKNGKKPKTLKGKARRGVAQKFDVVVWDESHLLKNPEAARTKIAEKINAQAGFVLWLSATAGTNPLDVSYLAPLLAQTTGDNVSSLKDFEAWCKRKGFGLSRQKFGKWVWDGSQDDIKRVKKMLFDGALPVGLRRRPQEIAGWPEINRILLPVELTREDAVLYQAAWTEFRDELGLEGRAWDSNNALVARLRFRQKSSILRVFGTVSHTLNLLENGHQVAISVAFRETLQTIVAALEKEGCPCAQIHGDLAPAEKERQRMSFQRGDAKVVLFTVTEGISLHQGEHNDAPRSMVIHDLRFSSIEQRQIEGRCHRNGVYAQVYWMIAAGTIDQTIAGVLVNRMKTMDAMMGDGGNTIDAIEDALRRL